MSNLGRKVQYAQLHTACFAKSVGTFGPALDSVQNQLGKIKNLKMVWGENTLEVTINNQQVGVPHTNVAFVVWETDQPTLSVTPITKGNSETHNTSANKPS